MTQSAVDFNDVQGLVRFGFGKMKEAAYVHLRIRDPVAARSWLEDAQKQITTAVELLNPPRTAMQIAFTAMGLEALDVPRAVIDGFSVEFRTGMTEESRSRRLGDVGSNTPTEWDWGYGNTVPHLMVMFFAEPTLLQGFMEQCRDARWHAAFDELRCLGTADLDGVEPFGFADGISQPSIDWEGQRDITSVQIDFTNVVALGEFLLGYPNEYNKYTDRPLVDSGSMGADGLLSAEDAPGKKDVGRNGTYLVMRQLRQDIRRFWQYLNEQAGGNLAGAEKLGASLVGRTRTGSPLVKPQQASIPGIGDDPDEASLNRFTYASDPTGAACPFGAHVRRQNPRNADYPGRPGCLGRLITRLGFGPKGYWDDLISPVRFHRILRRGREYGAELLPEKALTPAAADEHERGLHFICLNASISRQFEFLQNAWAIHSKFAGLTAENDPLIGVRDATLDGTVTDNFTIPRDNGVPQRLSGLPQFVTVRGGAYFFLPSLRALRYLIQAGGV